MANLLGIDITVDINAFKGDDHRYRRIIAMLIEHGHSFAVHGGRLWLSVSGLERLLEEGLLNA